MHFSRALVVGARRGSLGEEIAAHLETECHVYTAGISGEEQIRLNARETMSGHLHKFFYDGPVEIVVTTVGENRENHPDQSWWLESMREEFETNFWSNLRLFDAWDRAWRSNIERGVKPRGQRHFVFISSNSAQVARSTSVGYCTSKAALSMAARCLGRYRAGTPSSDEQPPAVWAVEPGWMDDTPMSKVVEERLDGLPPHRIPGGKGIKIREVAALVSSQVLSGGYAANGTVLRLDGGDQ